MGEEILGDLSGLNDAAPRKGMLIIHGAGNWEENYWEPIARDVEQFTGGTAFAALGVYYCDVPVPVRTLAAGSASPTQEMAKFQKDFLDGLLRDHLLTQVATMPQADLWSKLVLTALPGGASLPGILAAANHISKFLNAPDSLLDMLTHSILGMSLSDARKQIENTLKPAESSIGSTIQDVTRYLYDPVYAQNIRQKMIAGLKQMQKYDAVVLVSHSLGTVIAFDTLNEWAESTPKISHWFTLGCPLTKVLRLRPDTPNQLKNSNVKYWFNVYDSTDLVAGQLGPSFTKEGTGIHDIFVDVADDPINSHDYFHNKTTLNLIADVMR